MSFDGFFISKIIEETREILIDGRVEKIVFDDENAFFFSIHKQKNKYNLLFDLSPSSCSFYLTDKESENYSSQFLQTLKKHLAGSILKDITQYKSDRVITFTFETNDYIDGKVNKNLIFEAMGKHANLFLVIDGVIIDCHKKMFNENGRTLLPKADFVYFPSVKEDFKVIDYSSIHSPKDLVDKYLGVSPILSNYLFDKKIQVQDIIIKPTLNNETKKFYCADIFESNDKTHFDSLFQLLDRKTKKLDSTFKKESEFVKRNLEKHYKKRELLLLKKDDSFADLKYKNLGDLVYSSGLNLNESLSEVNGIKLDSSKTLNQNAQVFYKKYQKAKRSIIHIDEQIETNDELIEVLEICKDELEFSSFDSIESLQKVLTKYGYKSSSTKTKAKKNIDPTITKISFENSTIFIGRNSVQNEFLIHKLAKKDDYWFHVKDGSGSHVVVETNVLDENIIRLASQIAAYYSRLRYSSSIAVDYTQIKHLRKIPKKPLYSVTYSNHKTIFIDIDEQELLKQIS